MLDEHGAGTACDGAWHVALEAYSVPAKGAGQWHGVDDYHRPPVRERLRGTLGEGGAGGVVGGAARVGDLAFAGGAGSLAGAEVEWMGGDKGSAPVGSV